MSDCRVWLLNAENDRATDKEYAFRSTRERTADTDTDLVGALEHK